jgi:hypothetical protein
MYNYGQKLQTIHMKIILLPLAAVPCIISFSVTNKGYQVTGSDDAILSLQSLD